MSTPNESSVPAGDPNEVADVQKQEEVPADEWADAKEYADTPAQLKRKVGKEKFLLCELGGDDLAKWMKFVATRVKGDSKGVKGKDSDFRDYHANLIVMCIKTDGGAAVPFSKVKGWPSSTLNGLFEDCQTMNGLNDEGKEQAKKS